MLAQFLDRERVAGRIAAAAEFPVVLLRGSAGWGKSAALRSYLQTQRGAVAFYDVLHEQRTFARFVRGFADALGTHAPGARLSFASAHDRAMQSQQPEHDLSTWLYEHIKNAGLTIAIDNLHNADADPAIRTFLARLIEMSKERTRWIIASRSADYLPLPGWMASGHMGVPVEESDLAFTQAETAALAAQIGRPLTHAEIADAQARTSGWATGVAYLLHTGDPAASTEPVRSYAPLIEKTLSELDTWTVRALLSTCLLPDLSADLLSAEGSESAARAIATLEQTAPYLFVRGADRPRYHDEFARALRRRLNEDSRAKQSAVEIAASLLRRKNRFLETLHVYMDAGGMEHAVGILAYHGLALIEQGHADVVERALGRMQHIRALPPSVVALRAIIDSRLGRYDMAEAWFNQAIAGADEEKDDAQMIEIKYLYACDLMRRDRLDCIPLLQAHAEDETLPLGLRASIRSALAEALMLAEDRPAALAMLESALELTGGLFDEALRARVLARAAYVYLYQDNYESAKHYALEAAAIAERESMFYVATGAYSVLYAISFDAEEPLEALRYLERLLENGLKSGNLQFHFYYLACAFEIQVERHEIDAVRNIEEALRSFDLEFDTATSSEAFLPGYALRASWAGNFDQAFRLLAPTAESQASPDRKALRWAEIALYAAGAGLRGEAQAALASAAAALERVAGTSNRAARAKLLGVFADAVLSGGAKTVDACWTVDPAALPSRLQAWHAAITALRAGLHGDFNAAGIEDALREMRETQSGGVARMFEMLPVPQTGSRVIRRSAAQTIDGIERALNDSREEIAALALQRATLPSERTIAADLIVHEMLVQLSRASAERDTAPLHDWLEATYSRHGDMACLRSLVAETWQQVLVIGKQEKRIGNGETLAPIARVVEEALRKPRKVHTPALETLDPIDLCINDLITRIFEKDVLTGEHSRAVSLWCARLARKLGLNNADMALVQRGGLLHDVGKIATPQDILNAPRRLADDEWETMRLHTIEGHRIAAEIPLLAAFMPAIRSHHERIDGKGYPDGVAGSAIPLTVRIVSVADCFNAMIGRRPYRPPMEPFRAIHELQTSTKGQLDPEVVAAMAAVVEGR